MKRLAWILVGALGIAGCSAEEPPSALPTSFPPGPRRPADAAVPERPARLEPVVASCTARCARLERIGASSELPPPLYTPNESASVTFGGDPTSGHWYVSWLGPTKGVTHVQRFDANGAPDGAARRFEGTSSNRLLWNGSGGAGELLVLGTLEQERRHGSAFSLRRFDAALAPTGEPLLMRAPALVTRGPTYEIAPDGSLVGTSVLDRAKQLVREQRIRLEAGVAQTPELRDWRLPFTTQSFAAFQRIGDRRFAVIHNGSAIEVRTLGPDGAVSPPVPVLETAVESDYFVTWSEQIGSTWWVGGYYANTSTKVSLRRVSLDPIAGLGEPIEITWPSGGAHWLVDANGTPAIVGRLDGYEVFAPIDVQGSGLCRPSVIRGADGAAYHVNALHFAGAIAGMVLEGDAIPAGGGPRWLFTRAACRRGG